MGECDLGFLISDFGLGTLLRSVSVKLAELRRAGVNGSKESLMMGQNLSHLLV